jgi:AcrR family transcriptional regulator
VTVRPHAARLPAARRRQQLLGVALQVFGERGFHPASMNEVAEAAGVTKPVLYQHFRSKRDLYREVLTDVGAQLLDAITKATTAATSPHEQVELGFIAYFRWVAANEAAFRVLFGGGTRRDEEFAAQVAKVESAIAEAIATLIDVEGLDAPQRRQLAHGLVGLAEGTSRLWMAEGADQPPEALARLVADLAWRGLRGIRGAS